MTSTGRSAHSRFAQIFLVQFYGFFELGLTVHDRTDVLLKHARFEPGHMQSVFYRVNANSGGAGLPAKDFSRSDARRGRRE